jgi:hypothetical protein
MRQQLGVVAFFVATKSQQKMMTHCNHLLLKHKEKGNGSNHHCLLGCNKTREEDQCAIIFIFSSTKEKATTIVAITFFIATEP